MIGIGIKKTQRTASAFFILREGKSDFMYYIVDSNKSFNQASTDLESAVIVDGLKQAGFTGESLPT